MGGVVDHGDESLGSQPLRVLADGLFLHTAGRMNSDKGRVFLILVEIVRKVEVSRDLYGLVPE